MKKILLCLPFLLLIAACGKKGKFEQIKGVYLRDENNIPIGKLGEPDVYEKDLNFEMIFFPNPSVAYVTMEIVNEASTSRSYELVIVPAFFKNAPERVEEKPFPFATWLDGKEIKVDNLGGKPKDVLFRETFTVAPESYYRMAIDHTGFKQGFYRIVVTSDEGQSYWSNLWIFHPE